MAIPIPLKVTREPGEVARESLSRLEAARVKNAEALLAGYELLQQLHDRGILDLARGLAGARDDIATRLAAAANTPETIRALRNLLSLARILSTIDPDVLDRLARELSAQKPLEAVTPPSLWRILLGFGSKDSRRGLAAVIRGIQVFGRVLLKTAP